MLGAVRVRGNLDNSQKVSQTLENVNLTRRNQLVVFEENKSVRGMFKTAKDYIAFGKVSEELLEQLAEKSGKGKVEHGDLFSLSPPTGGFRGTKKHYNQGGSLGERESLDTLLEKMI